jgi:hypothetical protein
MACNVAAFNRHARLLVHMGLAVENHFRRVPTVAFHLISIRVFREIQSVVSLADFRIDSP